MLMEFYQKSKQITNLLLFYMSQFMHNLSGSVEKIPVFTNKSVITKVNKERSYGELLSHVTIKLYFNCIIALI